MLHFLFFAAACLCAYSRAEDVRVEGRAEDRVTHRPTPPTGTGTAPPCALTAFPIANGGFEDGTLDGWIPLTRHGEGSAQVVSPGWASQFAAQLSITNHSKEGVVLKQRFIPVCAATFYELAFDIWIPYASHNCYFFIDMPHNYSYFTFQGQPWAHYTQIFSTHAIDYMEIGAVVYCGHQQTPNFTVLLDNFSITRLPENMEFADCPREVHVANGGFEDGSFETWKVKDATSNVNYSLVPGGAVPDSKYMFQADIHGASDTSSGFQLKRDVFNLCMGYKYTFGFTYRFNNYDFAGFPDFCSLTFIDRGCLRQKADTPWMALYPPNDTWTYAEYACVASKNGDNVIDFKVLCEADGGSPPYNSTDFSFQLDNVALTLDANQ